MKLEATTWIVRWSSVVDDQQYLVLPVNAREDGSLYLGGRGEKMAGWEVKSLLEGCYAALLLPDFDPAIMKG